MAPRSFPNEKSAHAQLDRILASPPFANSIRSQRFLRYVVENSLRACEEPLKEFAIAVEAFDRDASYDPAVDATVRVEAGRLRLRLREYYANAGRHDPLLIEIPRGSYRAVFTLQVPAQIGPFIEPVVEDETRNERPKKGSRRRLRVWLLSGIAVVSVCLAAAIWYLHRPLPPPLRVAEYTQLTHDGNFKFLLGADASRIYPT